MLQAYDFLQLFSNTCEWLLLFIKIEVNYCICKLLYLFVFADINECSREEHGCEHICINTVGSYYCMCRNGYFLHQDGRICLGRTIFYIAFNINELGYRQTLIVNYSPFMTICYFKLCF